MNSLNSILLEGTLVADPENMVSEELSGVKNCCRFGIENHRYCKVAGESVKEEYIYEIETKGKFAIQCLEHLKKGRGVRVVGSLVQREVELGDMKYMKVYIRAEHVEFKPVYTQSHADAIAK